MIKENGGTFMQQARNTQYVIAGTESKHGDHCLQDAVYWLDHGTDILVQGIIRQGIYDVILPQWIADCVEKQDLIPLQPK